MLKLSVLACARGYPIASNLNSPLNPTLTEIDIYFHTSNGVDNYGGMFGHGWCISKHVNSRPLGVAVRYISAYEYWFYIKLAGLPGDIVVTETHSPLTTWVRDIRGPLTTIAPTFNVWPLLITSQMHSMNGTYSTWSSL
jgi:hypothetical protein